jgi:hypothetical protein
MMSKVMNRMRLRPFALLLMLLSGGALTVFAQGKVVSVPTPAPAAKPKVVQPKPIRSTFRFDGVKGSVIPGWDKDIQVTSKEDLNRMVAAPWFQGASLDRDIVNLPYYDLVVPVSPNQEITVRTVDTEGLQELSTTAFRQSVAESGLRIQDDWYPASHVVPGPIEIRQGLHYQHVHVYPIRVNASGDRLQKATAVHYALSQTARARKSGATAGPAGVNARTYTTTSQLAAGTWFKLAVTREGIYRLDYDYFNQIGANPASINPNTIRIHGNGGGMLPQVAGEFPHDDLAENAIYFSGAGDGRFDPGDFLLFYGSSPNAVKYSTRLQRLYHQKNLYSDTTFYFLSWGGAAGKRMQTIQDAGAPTITPTTTKAISWIENDKFNPLLSGRAWLGETFDLTTKQTFSLNTPNIASGTNVKVIARVGARSNATSSFTFRENGTSYASLNVAFTQTASYGTHYYRSANTTFNIPGSALADGKVDLELEYVKPVSSAIGYLDFLEAEWERSLSTGGNAIMPIYAIGSGVFGYTVANAAGYRVWDVTDPTNVGEQAITFNGSALNFNVNVNGQKTFVAFKDGYLTPASARRVSNQNLHGLAQADYVIVTHPSFRTAADRLAAFHRSKHNLTVNVVEIQQIYNEFSSGAQDPTAVRDFMKMFYDRSAQNGSLAPRYLLFVGDGSYDYKGISASASANFLPTYQSRKSQRPTESYTSDDYFGFLDDGEGFWGENSAEVPGVPDMLFFVEGDTMINTHGLDIAVGRLPVSTASNANAVVDKIIRYINEPSGFGPWRNKVVLVADHKDDEGYIHLSQADSYGPDIEAADPCINVDKIYMDNYTMETTASGSKFPDGKSALLKSLDEGSLLVNYTGHGGEIGWSNSSILDIADINSLVNGNRLPAYITATCEFGRWDDPGRLSGAETLFLKEEGGSIAMFTTVRVVYSGPNFVLNQNFYNYVLNEDTIAGRMPTMGEVFMRTKNASWLNGINNRNFSLMGDPAMTLAYPELEAMITKINGQNVSNVLIDTLSALSLVTVEGEIRDASGQFQSNYTGDLYVTVFDKPAMFTTKRAPYNFFWQKNRIFNGTASVTNGQFSFQFVVPIDISYEDGLGKISLYTQNNQQDGAGCNKRIYIGGSGQGTIVDDKGPELELFMNDEKFVDGGMVSPDPLLLAQIFDDNGLNTVGTGIGHELTAILDGNEQDVIVLNDYYAASKNSYKEGKISYPFEDLSPGEHNLKVKVWDVANNSSSALINFVVADDANMALGHVLNYPNPFSTHTQFMIEHNRNGSVLDVQVKIFTVSGKLVKTLQDNFYADGNLYCDLTWDGLDDYGDALGRGVYVYQVVVRDDTRGGNISKFEKLVVLR